MSHSAIKSDYACVISGLATAEVAELWAAVLFGRPLSDHLADRGADLKALRDRVGLEGAARKNGAGA